MKASATNAGRRRSEERAHMDARFSLLAGSADQSGTSLRLEVGDVPPHAALAIRQHRAHLVLVLDETALQANGGALRLRLVAQNGKTSPDEEADPSSALFLRARGYIQSDPGDPRLSPEKVAAAMGASRASLYRAFQHKGGVAKVIRQARLEAARLALQDGGDRRRISEIAFAFGFQSDAQFSRAFRRVFSVSPSELRRSRTTDASA